ALTLAVGAIMAGVSVIGVVAACAPTKAKPAKPAEKKVEQPQTSGTESKNQENGSTTTGTKQGSETGGTTNSSGGSNNTTTGTTQKDPIVTNPNLGAKPEDKKMQDSDPSTGNGSESSKQGSLEAGGGASKEGKTGTDGETNGSQNKGTTQEQPNKQNSPGTNAENGGTQSGGSTTEQSENATTPGSSSQDNKENMNGGSENKDDTAKPVSVSLDTDANLTKKENKYELVLNVTNANDKFLEIELTEVVPEGEKASKPTAEAKITSNKATFTFQNLKEGTKYKVSSLMLYDTEDSTSPTNLKVSDELSSKELKTNDIAKSMNENSDQAGKTEITSASKKTEIKDKIKKLANLSKDEKETFNKKIDDLPDNSDLSEVDKVFEEANAKNEANLKAKQEEAKEIATTAQLTDLKVTRDTKEGYQSYFTFQLTTDTETYEKIKDKFLGFRLDVLGTNLFYEDITNGAGNTKTYKVSEKGGKVTFVVWPNQPQEKKDGTTYRIASIWIDGDPNKKNLLDKHADFQ
ncbi:hypothetical protein, partial [Ureaplasma diversum]|uniref:hypothetical protein n=1 Tax=Ureaplasma diversum TaxID=42094 RepID=UPI0018CBF9EE